MHSRLHHCCSVHQPTNSSLAKPTKNQAHNFALSTPTTPYLHLPSTIMKTFATTLLLLASATAAYGHSAKAGKADIRNNLSYSFIQSKSIKSKSYKEPIRGRRLLEEDHVHPGGMRDGKPESR